MNKDYISWDTYFMSIAMFSALRSKDPSTKNGAVIIDPETNHIISTGYNGMINGNDINFPWGRDSEKPSETKYPYVLHAECNAILNSNISPCNLKNKKMYLYSEKYFLPCSDCMKMIAQVGIKEIIFVDIISSNTDVYDWSATYKIKDVCNINFRTLKDFKDEIKEVFERMIKI